MAALLYRHPLGQALPRGPGSRGLIPQRPGDAGPDVLGSELWDPTTYVVDLSESVALSEGLATQATVAASLAETVALSEALAAGLTASLALAESVSLAESLGALRSVDVALSEGLSVAESLGALRLVGVGLAESVALADALGGEQSFGAALAESVAMAEALSARIQLPPVLRAGLTLSTTRTALTLSTTRTAATMTSILRSDTDSADIFRATLTRDGSPYSLVGAQSVSLRWRRRGGARGSLALTVVSAAGGVVERAWQADDLEPGAYEVQVRVVDTNGDQLSFPNHTYQTLTVLPAL